MAESLHTDVLIVGGGPSGLAMAIRLKQLDPNQEVYVLEKGQSPGNHNISGSVMDPSGMDALLPDWQTSFQDYEAVTRTQMLYLTERSSITLPHLPRANHYGGVILSLSKLTRYLAQRAQDLGVEILSGYSGKTLLEQDGRIIGVKTGDMGVGKDSAPISRYQEGIEIYAKHVAIAEGAYGYLARKIITKYNLENEPMTYGLGVKEIWRVDDQYYEPGLVIHTLGHPVPSDTYGGGFIYHGPDNKVFVGMIVGLDSPNPTMNPFKTLQQYKHHPRFEKLFQSGEPIAYGARVINEGGYQSIPKLDFPGGVLVGCAAGFVNIVRIKGIHAAIFSGIEAANSYLNRQSFDTNFRKHSIVRDLYRARNVRPAFRYGLFAGICITALDQYIFQGRMPFTFGHQQDYLSLNPKLKAIVYPKPDGKVSFDLLTMVQKTNTNHREDQPCHLKVVDKDMEKTVIESYQAPESHYCPANVYEPGDSQYTINHTNCIHCKACGIRSLKSYIHWELPEGGGGPNYSEV